MLNAIKEKIEDVGFNRCGNCPAYWQSVDYWGECDAGCSIHRDHLEFCPLSLLPKIIMKPYVSFKEKHEEKYFMKKYEEEMKKEEEI
ncbi:MAG: hypothetical protein ACE3JQ_02490 [Paenisporosarcina sp.]